MALKVHIDRLVIDPGVLSRREAPLFGETLARELTHLQNPSAEPRPPAATAVSRLARQTAAAIHARLSQP